MARRRGDRGHGNRNGERRSGNVRPGGAVSGGIGANRPSFATASVPAVALLPIRLFFGVTFLFAGLDKLISPSFLRAGDPGSLGAQMEVFARTSPLSGLLRLAVPLAPEIGLLIAVGEIAIGLGALTGLAFRLAAAGGAVLSLLLWLTASWSTHPFYYGADLPYLAGWAVLALAGHGNLLVARRFIDGLTPPAILDGPAAGRAAAVSPGRRAALQAGVLGALAVIVASLATPLRFVLGGTDDGSPTLAAPTPGPTSGQTPGTIGSGTPSPTARPTPGAHAGIPIGRTSDVERAGSVSFVIPFDAPAPLPVGDPGVIVRLANGTFVAFDAVCTHAGCTVEWDAVDGILICPCHGAEFDVTAGGAVITGPTITPLTPLPLTIDVASGTILLRT